jgi:hypothetical protein
MGILEAVSSKLLGANDAIADAHKAWRDDELNKREEAVQRREALVAAQLAEARRLESGWFRQKVGFVSGLVVGAVPAFLFGFIVAVSSGTDRTPTRSPGSIAARSQPATDQRRATQEENPEEPVVGGAAEAPTVSVPVKSHSTPMDFEECVTGIT